MKHKSELLSNLLSSVSGVLIFISLEHWIHLNGFASFAPFIIGLGMFILFWITTVLKWTKNIGFVTKPFLLTLSHILIFVGSKHYFDKYLTNHWILFLIIGVILLNHHEEIAHKLLGGR